MPVSLQGAPGNLQFVPGDHVMNALGAASYFTVVRGILRAVVEYPQGVSEEHFEEFEKTLDFLGTEDLAKYVESLLATVRRSRLSRFARFMQTSATLSPHQWPRKPSVLSLQSSKALPPPRGTRGRRRRRTQNCCHLQENSQRIKLTHLTNGHLRSDRIWELKGATRF